LPSDGWRMSLVRYEALRARGWHVEAERALAEARSANPEACAPLDGALSVAREQRDYRRAREVATALVKCAPETEELASLLRETGAPKEAAAEYRRLLAINPGR